MNIKKRSIVSILLILAMAFSLLAFASCSSSGDKEETITVHMTVIGPNNESISDTDLKLTDYANNLTAAYATQYLCTQVEQIAYNYDPDAKMVTQIGDYINESANSAATSETDADGNVITTEATSVAMTGLFWQLLINGNEASSGDLIKDGDKISWSYVNLPITNQ
ncbi:MAG: hypothetical protein FWD71_09535 [Oscillospiraceae bacterium]|nr:hypothetical protein [Oscillospiraceae bacterium]